MPYIVPNATDIGSLYNDLNQAEPDSLDFQILGDRSTGVLVGCEVSATPVSSTSVSVTEGYVALKGVVYPLQKSGARIALNTIIALPSIISNNKRFDLVVGRLTTVNNAQSMELLVLYGQESETNPTFPASPSRLGVIPSDPARYFNPDTDVILASVYRVGGSNTTQSHIVDKRVNVMSTTMIRGAAIPSPSFGLDGDFYYRLNSGLGTSGLYLKKNGIWVELILESDFRSANPIGAIMMWPGNTAPNATYWKECNGQTLPKNEYPELFAVLGNSYGNDTSTTFYLPDLRNKFIRGHTDVGPAIGITGGSDFVTLGVENLPSHNHGMNDHTHNIGSHTHNINVQNQNVMTSEAGDHSHFGDTSGNEVIVRLRTNPVNNYAIPYAGMTTAFGLLAGYGEGMHYNYSGTTTTRPGLIVNVAANSGSTSTAGRHSHTYLLNLSGTVEPSTAGFTGTSTQPNTTDTGGNTPFSNLPSYVSMRWFIRVK